MKLHMLLFVLLFLTSCGYEQPEVVDMRGFYEANSIEKCNHSRTINFQQMITILDDLNISHQYQSEDIESRICVIEYYNGEHDILIIPLSNDYRPLIIDSFNMDDEVFFEKMDLFIENNEGYTWSESMGFDLELDIDDDFEETIKLETDYLFVYNMCWYTDGEYYYRVYMGLNPNKTITVFAMNEGLKNPEIITLFIY